MMPKKLIGVGDLSEADSVAKEAAFIVVFKKIVPSVPSFDSIRVTATQHELLCKLVGTTAGNGKFGNRLEAMKALGPPQTTFVEWWRVVRTCKNIAQWRQKCVGFGFPSALSELLLADDMGMVIVGFLAFHGKCSHVPGSVMQGSSAPRAGLPAWQ